MNARGHWELVSPLPDLEIGTKGEYDPHTGGYLFGESDEEVTYVFLEAMMRRNPAIFKWVPEPVVRGCAVSNLNGQNCPNNASVPIHCHNSVLWLCRGCFANAEAGHYGVNFKNAAKEKPEPERVEWPEPRNCGMSKFPDEEYIQDGKVVSVYCEHSSQSLMVVSAFRAVLQALREGWGIYANDECIIRPDGSRP